MLLDAKKILCENFDMGDAATTGGAATTNVLNLGLGEDAFGNDQTPDISNDGEIHLNIFCDGEDVATTGGAGVITYELKASAAEAMTNADTIVEHDGDESPNDGDVILSQPLPARTIKQYLRLDVTSDVELSAGMISAYLTNHPVRNI